MSKMWPGAGLFSPTEMLSLRCLLRLVFENFSLSKVNILSLYKGIIEANLFLTDHLR